MTNRTSVGMWQAPAAPAEAGPPSALDLWNGLRRDFEEQGWEIYFRGSVWEALHPSCGLLTSPSAIGLREAIETAEQPRALTSPAVIPASQRLLSQGGRIGLLRQDPEARARQPVEHETQQERTPE